MKEKINVAIIAVISSLIVFYFFVSVAYFIGKAVGSREVNEKACYKYILETYGGKNGNKK